jgi:hypothetical protein
MQTSFMHPPFGFALFYLRSVAPAKDFTDKLTGKLTARVTTGQIYWGAVPFVLIQIIMVTLIIAVPGIVTGGIAKKQAVDIRNIQIEVPAEEPGSSGEPGASDQPGATDQGSEQEQAEKALERELGGGSEKPAKAK